MSRDRPSRPAIEFDTPEPPTLNDLPCVAVCDEFRALSYRVAQAEENQGLIMGELGEHRKILQKLDSRLDDQISNQSTLATTMAAASKTASNGGLLAAGGTGLLGAFEAARLIGHSLGWW